MAEIVRSLVSDAPKYAVICTFLDIGWIRCPFASELRLLSALDSRRFRGQLEADVVAQPFEQPAPNADWRELFSRTDEAVFRYAAFTIYCRAAVVPGNGSSCSSSIRASCRRESLAEWDSAFRCGVGLVVFAIRVASTSIL